MLKYAQIYDRLTRKQAGKYMVFFWLKLLKFSHWQVDQGAGGQEQVNFPDNRLWLYESIGLGVTFWRSTWDLRFISDNILFAHSCLSRMLATCWIWQFTLTKGWSVRAIRWCSMQNFQACSSFPRQIVWFCLTSARRQSRICLPSCIVRPTGKMVF